ncbi:MAG TPA: alpha/beta fold hydrolase [Candidatus Dormibacteraeota bacterium]
MPPQDSWISVPVRRPEARLRLYCVPYAGSGAGVFRSWPEGLGAQIEVRSVMLPGRDRRFNEPALSSVRAQADLLVPALRDTLDPPFAIFGHSMGAMLGFEVAHRLTDAGRPPVRLLVSGASAPHLRNGRSRFHQLPDDEFTARIRDLGGTPPELVAHEEFMQMMLPTLRADFTAAETYDRPLGRPLPCPITVFGGADDPLVTPADLDGWSGHAGGGFRVHVLPGDHFFLTSSQAQLISLIGEELAIDLEGSAPPRL